MAVILLIQDPQGQLAELPLLQKIVLGRSSSCDYKIEDSKISGKHCTFESTQKGEVIFTDLESTNGSFLNNSKISKTIVKINDVIKIGGTTIRIDEKRLNPGEKKTIGYEAISTKRNEDKTLPMVGKKPQASEPMTKKSVALRKALKDKKSQPAAFTSKDSIIEQEASSGTTKMLKLDKKTGKKR